MTDATRRRFLAMTGAGAVAVSAVTLTPSAFAGDEHGGAVSADGQGGQAQATAGPLVAYVNDVSTGEISVMAGDREVTVVDRDLAARIARLSRAGA